MINNRYHTDRKGERHVKNCKNCKHYSGEGIQPYRWHESTYPYCSHYNDWMNKNGIDGEDCIAYVFKPVVENETD